MIDRRGKPASQTIVFLHGATASRTMWAPQMAVLASDFDVVAFDLPGHGARMDEPFSLEGASQVVLETLDEAGIPSAVLVGLSLGGYVALAVAASHPDRVDGIVLSGATASYRGWGGFSTKVYGVLFPLLGNRLREKSDASLRKIAPAEFVDEILSQPSSFAGGGQALRDVPGRDYRRMASDYPGPMLLLNGERDTVNRKEEADFLKHRPGTRVEMVADGGHACSLSQWKAFSEAIRRFAAIDIRTN